MESRIISREIAPNIYWVEKQSECLLYAPLKSQVAKGRKAKIARWFVGFLTNTLEIPEIISLPTTVTLDLTHLCPLGCVYCSVDSGRDNVFLGIDIAKAAIDLVIINAQKLGVTSVGVVFGGGGEPTLAWGVLTEAILYAQKKAHGAGITPQILVATGGILDQTRVGWLAKNTTHIALSFDGPEMIQNVHRPLASGKSSFDAVVRTAAVLKELNADFSIRAAISDLNADLTGLVEFFAHFRPKFLNFQPVVVCGRCYSTGWKGLEPDRFVQEFKGAKLVGREKNTPVVFPGTRIDRVIPEMCHAYNGTGFVVTNHGLVSACERVVSANDCFADLFVYGEYVDGVLQIDQQKLSKLKDITVDRIPYCVNCFCRWHCCGGCLNDHLSQPESKEDPFLTRTNVMCYLTREIVWDLLWEAAS